MAHTDLGTLIRNFFEQHLVAQRGLSAHTVLAYRDAWKFFLQFACRHHRKTCVNLTLADLAADTLRRFLDHLERDRHNTAPTRNARLAAIHSFFQWWVREWRCHHSLPVVAIGSIPYIDRRAPFGLRATPADESTAAVRSVRTE